MFIPPVLAYKNNTPAVQFQGKTSSITEIADLRVFHHHIYEFKKGIRNLILTTEKSKYKETIASRLQKDNIDFVIHDIDKNKINVYFGAKECIDELSAEQDFMLGIMLGYDRVKQCERYMKIKNGEIKLGKKPL